MRGRVEETLVLVADTLSQVHNRAGVRWAEEHVAALFAALQEAAVERGWEMRWGRTRITFPASGPCDRPDPAKPASPSGPSWGAKYRRMREELAEQASVARTQSAGLLAALRRLADALKGMLVNQGHAPGADNNTAQGPAALLSQEQLEELVHDKIGAALDALTKRGDHPEVGEHIRPLLAEVLLEAK